MPKVPNTKHRNEVDKDQLIADLSTRIQALEKVIAELNGKLSLNSSNSGKPPSSDGFNKPANPSKGGKSNQNTSTRERGKNKSSGQTGHDGTIRYQSDTPDEVHYHLPPSHCYCGAALGDFNPVETRQVFVIPPHQPDSD